MKINFNVPYIEGSESYNLNSLISSTNKFSGDGQFTKSCTDILQSISNVKKVLLTPSCTHALEMSAILLDLKPGDEVLMPSFTFVSTANAFALRGAVIKFIDIRPDTLNIDESKIEEAITSKTKAIVVVHYAGVACEMKNILEIASKYNLHVVEDAAQALGSKYESQHCGTMGTFGTISFHETKNIHCGEGGCLYINDKEYELAAEIIREKGTNRSQFIRGHVDKYTWRSIGSSYLLSEINAAFLLPQLETLHKVNSKRINTWNKYYKAFEELETKGFVRRPIIPHNVSHNGHLFYLITQNNLDRNNLLMFLNQKGIGATFHYLPLHSTEIGRKLGHFSGTDENTTLMSERLIRLPLHYSLTDAEIQAIIEAVKGFYYA